MVNMDEKLACHKCGRRKKRSSLSQVSKSRNWHLCKKCCKVKRTRGEVAKEEGEMVLPEESTIDGDATAMVDEDANSMSKDQVATNSVAEDDDADILANDQSDSACDGDQHFDRLLLDSWRLDPRHLIGWVSKSIRRDIVDDRFLIDDLYKLSDSELAQSRFERDDRDRGLRNDRMTYDQRRKCFNKAMPTAGVFRKAFLRYALIRSKKDTLLLLTFLYFLSSVADPSVSGSTWPTMRGDIFRFCNERFGKKIGYMDWLPRI